MIKLLIGGSPCTYWSIAQKNNRETEASGTGWELFRNYLIAKEKFQPDFFLYENNKSAAEPIKAQIRKELDVWEGTLFTDDSGARYIEINSALVSAQKRERFYVHNLGDVTQPEDRGILLPDILELGGVTDMQKSRTMTASIGRTTEREYFVKHQNTMAFEPIRVGSLPRPNGELSQSQGFRIYDSRGKSVTIKGLSGGSGGKTGLYAIPVNVTEDGKSQTIKATYSFTSIPNICVYNSTYGSTGVAQKTDEEPSEQFLSEGKDLNAMKRVYAVRGGQITIKGKQYPIKLEDGNYIIRKLTVKECCRLQTMPDDYCKAVSNSQAYKGLGNGWTAEVIIHLLNGALKDVPRDEEIVVLSMYDGIGTGRYCLDKMGFTNVKYFAYEIDKYAMAIAKDNYPDIIECGDAFQVREEGWNIWDYQ